MTKTLTNRLNEDLRERLDKARLAMPYAPTVTAVIERGIVLAIEEMGRMSSLATASELEGRSNG